MNVIGEWKIAQFLTVDDDRNMIWKDAQEEINNPDADPSDVKSLKTTIKFCEEGVLKAYMPIPEGVTQEQLDEAVASGHIQLEDGKMLIEQNAWKEENGKIYCDTGIEGEMLGEKVSPWEEVKFDGDVLEIMTYKYNRI